MKTKLTFKLLGCCILLSGMMPPVHAQTAPSLTFSQFVPTVAELSWPGSYTNWQLMSTTDLGTPAAWQPVAGTPLPLGSNLVMFYQMTSAICFFRLQQNTGGGGGSDFQATPSTIAFGNSSTLSWTANTGTTYRIQPGIGVVTGTNYVVSPPVTMIYTLTASNSSGTVSSQQVQVDVVFPSCSFVGAKGWDCTFHCVYKLIAGTSDYDFNFDQESQLTFHLSPSQVSANAATFTGTLMGFAMLLNAETNNTINPPAFLVDDGTGPAAGSIVHLRVDCVNGVYRLDITPTGNGTRNFEAPFVASVGTVFINNRALPASFGSLHSAGTESLPAHNSLWAGGGDYYMPGDIGDAAFATGAVTDSTAGSAAVSWTFTPSP